MDSYSKPLNELPLHIIIEYPEMKEYLYQEQQRIKKFYREKYPLKKNHIGDAHSWLLVFHYKALDVIKKTYPIDMDEFVILNTARLISAIRNVYYFSPESLIRFSEKKNEKSILSNIDNLIKNGFLYPDVKFWGKEPREKLHISEKGFEVIEAFYREFRQCYLEFEEQVGDIPGHMILKKQ